MLISLNIQPIMVFDGRDLPAKAETETKRKSDREAAKLKANQCMRAGKIKEAQTEFSKAVDVGHEHAIELMKECRKLGVDCITAMFEADSQLAYLNKIGVADYVISEDSDLILFGCTKIIFKLQLDGTCLLFDSEKLHMTIGTTKEKFDFEKFLRICILSGCDYLASLNGIGLAKARKFIEMIEETDMRKALPKIPSHLNMMKLRITEDYIEGFLKAEATFKHMLVYDPVKRETVRLNPLTPGMNNELCTNAGEFLEPQIAYQLALGNLDPKTLQNLENFDPQVNLPVTAMMVRKHPSIWAHYSYVPKAPEKSSVLQNLGNENDIKHQQHKRNSYQHSNKGSRSNNEPSPLMKRLSKMKYSDVKQQEVNPKHRFYLVKSQVNQPPAMESKDEISENDQNDIATSLTQLHKKLKCGMEDGRI